MEGNDVDFGIIPRAILDVFSALNSNYDNPTQSSTATDPACPRFSESNITVSVSYVEVYNDRVRDLIRPSCPDVVLRDLGPHVHTSATRTCVRTATEALAVLKQGAAVRAVGDTPMNARSSRSHTVFTIHIFRHQNISPVLHLDHQIVKESTIQLVDLAGSERVRHTKATGSRLREGGHINQSLLVLGTIISRLSASAAASPQQSAQSLGHLPFRDSKLTRLLRPALQPGTGARIAVLATITPAAAYVDETLSTLQFASRAKTIPLASSTSDSSTCRDRMEDDGEYKRRYATLSKEFDSFRETFAQLQTELAQLRQVSAPPTGTHSATSRSCSDIEPTDSTAISSNSSSPPSLCNSSSNSSYSTTSTTNSSLSVPISRSTSSSSTTSSSSSSSSFSEEQDYRECMLDSSSHVGSESGKTTVREKALSVQIEELELENEHLRDRLRMMVADVCRQRLRSAMLHSLAQSRASSEHEKTRDVEPEENRLEGGKQSEQRFCLVPVPKAGINIMGNIDTGKALAADAEDVVRNEGNDEIVSAVCRNEIELSNVSKTKLVKTSDKVQDIKECGDAQVNVATVGLPVMEPAISSNGELVVYFKRMLENSTCHGEGQDRPNMWLVEAAANVSFLVRFMVAALKGKRQS